MNCPTCDANPFLIESTRKYANRHRTGWGTTPRKRTPPCETALMCERAWNRARYEANVDGYTDKHLARGRERHARLQLTSEEYRFENARRAKEWRMYGREAWSEHTQLD